MWLNLLLFDELVRLLEWIEWNLQKYLCYLRTPERDAELIREFLFSEEREELIHIDIGLSELRRRFEELQSCIKKYDDEIAERPQDAMIIAEQAIEYIEEQVHIHGALEPRLEKALRILLKIVLVDKKTLLKINEILHRLRQESKRYAEPEDRSTATKFINALDLLLEHVVLQILWFLENPAEYNERMREFTTNYSDDAKMHILLITSAIMLLRLLRKERPLWLVTEELRKKRGIAIEKLSEIAEELESFTVTFQLMKSRILEEEPKIASSAKSVEELRKVLSLE